MLMYVTNFRKKWLILVHYNFKNILHRQTARLVKIIIGEWVKDIS